MATYYKPQSPIQSGEDFIYPITTADQIMKSDNSRRLEQAGLIVADNSINLDGVAAQNYALKSDTVPTSRMVNGVALSTDISLKFSNLANEFYGGGTAGTAGYVAFAQLEITGSYTNRPIEFELICRRRKLSCLVSVAFTNLNSTDPTLDSIYYRGPSYGIFIQKVATSTWLLYYTKSEGYDSLTVRRVSVASQQVTITHPGSFVETKPTSNVIDAISYELEKTYPVGAIYISTSSTSPASLFGGTWEQLKDQFLLGAGGSYTAGGTGSVTATSGTSTKPLYLAVYMWKRVS